MSKFDLLFLKNVSSKLNKRLIISHFFIAILFCFSSFAQSAKDYLKKGHATDNRKDAIVEFSKALSLSPNFFEAYYLRAKDKHFIKDLKGSVIDFKKAISLKPNFAYSYFHIGMVYQELGKYDEAITYFLKFIEILKIDEDSDMLEVNSEIVLTDCDAHVRIGESYYFQENFKDAIIYFSKALETCQENSEVFYRRGKAKANLNDYQGAILDYNRAIALDSNDARYYKSRGYAMYSIEDYQGVVNDYLQEIRINPNDPELYLSLGKFQNLYLKQHFDAIKNINLAISRGHLSVSNCLLERGWAKSYLKDYRGAVIDFSKALESNPQLNECYYGRGDAKFNLEDYRGANTDLTKYINIAPKGLFIKLAYNRRGLAKIFLKQKDSACLDFSKAGELGYEDAYESIKLFCN